jgi:hypothetical protein
LQNVRKLSIPFIMQYDSRLDGCGVWQFHTRRARIGKHLPGLRQIWHMIWYIARTELGAGVRVFIHGGDGAVPLGRFVLKCMDTSTNV